MATTEHPDEQPILRILARRFGRWIDRETGNTNFARLLFTHALGAAGDALVALALAGSLFFSVPEADARSRVVLYLALTVAPFSVVAPLMSRYLDRHRGGLRFTLAFANVGRALLTWLMATRLDSLLLFPISFGILVLSRITLVTRAAALPFVIPEGRSLVEANASLSKFSALAGFVVVPIGVGLVRWPGVRIEVLSGAIVYALATLPALGVSAGRGKRKRSEVEAARGGPQPLAVRQALVAMAGTRALVGFLVFHLAFSLRREGLGSLGLGFLLGSAALGTLFGAVVAPRLRRGLKEEGIVVIALLLSVAAAAFAAFRFGIPSVALLIGAFGVASGAIKVAFDSIVQRDVNEAVRGRAFARFEAGLQLSWVAGALIPVVISLPARVGTIVAGAGTLVLVITYLVARRGAVAKT
ncbi:MAG: hypothetical protein QOG54_2701 [Actinomycetota bacterium]|nr:hypothetical protein [Actinomycetota bacterium]